MNKIILESKEMLKKLNFLESHTVEIDYFKLDNNKVYLKFLNNNKDEILLDITDMLESILDEDDEITYDNIQKIFKYLPEKTKFKRDKEKNLYFDKYKMYKMLYKACEKAKEVKKELYVEIN